MRPQQNRRISRRGNNTGGNMRRAPNPLTRNYESNGPEVKIRGNAQHIADKYLTLARDAQASGDRIIGENYLQHAEHYLRIILSAQAAEKDRAAPLVRAEAETPAAEESDFSEAEEYADMPQPVIDGLPGEVALMHKNGGYKRAEGSEGGEEYGKYPRARQQPRRRLPARRGGVNAAPYPREDNGERSAPEQSGDNAAVYQNGRNGAELDEAGKTAARKRPVRRARPAADTEADQPDV